MGRAKEIRVEPISRQDADRIIKRLHYSGKVVNNSQLHFGVFYRGRCGGAMQFGPPLDWRNAATAWPSLKQRQAVELNRLAFADWLPRNSESRAIRCAARDILRLGPELIQSYADGTRCGDGAIYRAAGFFLLSVKRNSDLWSTPNGVQHTINFQLNHPTPIQATARRATGLDTASGVKLLRAWGAVRLEGFQLRYALPLTDRARKAIVLPILPYSAIGDAGARMYRGKRLASRDSAVPADQAGEGGASPTARLHSLAS